MTLQEAIEILEYHREAAGEVAGSEFANALHLGIEAGKVVEILRDQEFYPACYLLLGETEERG